MPLPRALKSLTINTTDMRNYNQPPGRVASETFGTAVVKTDEALLFVKAAMENGSDMDTAYEDMKMIDNILNVKRIHFAIHGQIRRTSAGYYRKGSDLYTAIDGIISARAAGVPM